MRRRECTKRVEWSGAGLALAVAISLIPGAVRAAEPCAGLPTATQLRPLFDKVYQGQDVSTALGPGTGVGGIFSGRLMWIAIVDRRGVLCVLTSSADPMDVQPGSEYLSSAKAFTAMAFSNRLLPFSTANLQLLTQPGHSLYGLPNAIPMAPNAIEPTERAVPRREKVVGGLVAYAGGVPLYDRNGWLIGGLGVSGDTACTDHEVAKRLRDLAGLNPPGGPLADDIQYVGADPPSMLAHAVCLNTVRNGVFIGNEKP